MAKEKKAKKGGLSEQGQRLAQYFCDNIGLNKLCNRPLDKKDFMRQVGIAKKLLTQYSYRQCVSVIDYLIKHPPRGGLSSLNFLNYVADEVLKTIAYEQKAKEAKEKMKVTMDNDTDLSNKRKYNSNRTNKIIGMKKF